jgi:hypothetical protein
VAVRDGLIASNPAAKVKRPGIARTEARYLFAADVARLLAAAEGLRYDLTVVVLATQDQRFFTSLETRELVAVHSPDAQATTSCSAWVMRSAPISPPRVTQR